MLVYLHSHNGEVIKEGVMELDYGISLQTVMMVLKSV